MHVRPLRSGGSPHDRSYEPNELLDCDYSITQATQEQTAILRALGFTSLIRHQELASRITPR